MPKAPDANDILRGAGDAALREHLDQATSFNGHSKPGDTSALNGNHGASEVDTFTAMSLRHKAFAPINWIVQGFLCEGLTLLAGRPKIGKSWLALDLALGVTSNQHVMGGISASHGDALVLALEDNPRRLQRRLRKLVPSSTTEWPSRLTFATSWRRTDQGGVDDIREWAGRAAAPRLVVIDVLQAIRPLKTGKSSNGYADDYEALTTLQHLAGDLAIAILVLTHTRKIEAEDRIDMISGTLGLSGCADTVMVLDRSGQGTTLYTRGRDVEESERAMQFSGETCRWRILGDAGTVLRSEERKTVLSVFEEATGPLSPKQIMEACEMTDTSVWKILSRMAREGEVKKVDRGLYALPHRLNEKGGVSRS